MLNKIQIKTVFGDVLFEFEKEDNTIKDTLLEAVRTGAYLRDADLTGADLTGAYLRDAKSLPATYINECCQQMLYIFEHTKGEIPYLREKLMNGEVDGTQYEGDCACLIGSLANKDKISSDELCKNHIPFYTKGLHNVAEQWFWNIKKGDTPENSEFAKKALEIIDIVLTEKPHCSNIV